MDPLSRIRQCTATSPPAVGAVGVWILQHPTQAATLGIEDIAAASGSSTASVNRLARAAGYSGFIEMKAELLQMLRDVVNPIQKLRDEHGRESQAPMQQYVAMGQANIEQAAQVNSDTALADACSLVAQARKVFVLGFGMTTYVASWLADALVPYCDIVVNVAGAGGNERSAARMSRIAATDVLVVITLPRYSKDAESLADYARRRGAKVLVITDTPAAPVLAHADLQLFTPCAHPALSASYVAAQLMCEALVAEVMRRDPQAVEAAVELTNAVLPHLSVTSLPDRPRPRRPRT